MKYKSKEQFAHSRDNNLAGWDYAIRQALDKISSLKVAIQTFEQMRDSGEPWPGTSGSEDEVLGQDGVLGQSR